MMLDSDTIRRRRCELGLSQRALAKQLGVTTTAAARLERDVNHGELPLRTVARLAEVLALHPADLLADSQPSAADESHAPQVGDVAALLAEAGEPVTTTTVARVLELPLETVEQLTSELEGALADIGLRLHHGPDGLRLLADRRRVSGERLQTLLRAQ